MLVCCPASSGRRAKTGPRKDRRRMMGARSQMLQHDTVKIEGRIGEEVQGRRACRGRTPTQMVYAHVARQGRATQKIFIETGVSQ